MAHPETVAKKDGKAFRTHGVVIETGYFVDQDYDLIVLEHEERTPTGLLKVLELKPRNPSLPRFEGRWDEKRGKRPQPGALDIDMIDVDGTRLKDGFAEHHSPQLHGDDRRFLVEIRVPRCGRLIFSGVVSFRLGFALALGEEFTATSGISFSNELFRDGKLVPDEGSERAGH